ncbi:MAG TPA: queuosine salvage family protein, partial [Myxococcota bacterium]|nr:queuosine salvage family protein [Myxococcota bacterium]
TSLREHFERHGPWRAEQLAQLAPADCAAVFGQDLGAPEPAELMGLFAQAWNQLGAFLLARYGGRFAGPLAEADGDAERIAEILGEMPLFHDVARYDDLEVPFFKRAQITVADLAASDIGEQGDRLHGLERLTAFADNLVPHTLRCEGALHYAPALAARIERGEPIPAGSAEEVEIRAAGVHAVERLVAELGRRGVEATAASVDARLWHRGQSPAVKARPRHRTRTVFY